jgi:antitoxin component YwqK of YwqJK toxin-antitoxin module
MVEGVQESDQVFFEGFVEKIQANGLLVNQNFLKMLKTLDNFGFPESPVDGYDSPTKMFLEWRELGKKGSEDHHFWQGEGNSAGLKDGKVIEVYPRQGIEIGWYKKNVHHGQRIRIDSDGFKDVATYLVGKRDGFAMATWANGRTEAGNWANDKFNGTWVSTYANGGKKISIFDNGKPV